jgi:hypothetical protein
MGSTAEKSAPAAEKSQASATQIFLRSQGTVGGPPHYSSDIEVAWHVVEKLRERRFRIEIASAEGNQSGYTVAATETMLPDASTTRRVIRTEATAPLAICLVALRASGVDV